VIVLDASVLIAHLDPSDVHHTRAVETLLAGADRGFGASPITLADVLVEPARGQRLQAAEAALRDLRVVTLALPVDAAPRLAALRARTSLRLPDCCVLLAAQGTPPGRIASFDDGLLRGARALGIAVA
jgi:predicted nucleic acid-binding protein